jgi:hypothetical protein
MGGQSDKPQAEGDASDTNAASEGRSGPGGADAKEHTGTGQRRLGTACPACGVAVAPGYPRCPKCHAVMPSAAVNRNPRGTNATIRVRSTRPAADKTLWLGGAAIALVVVGFIVIAYRDKAGGTELSEAVADDGTEADEDDSLAEDLDASDEGDGDGDGDGEREGDDPDRAHDQAVDRLLESLADELGAARLWSSVSYESDQADVVRVESAFCSDDELYRIVDGNARALRDHGFVRLQCISRHGVLTVDRVLP